MKYFRVHFWYRYDYGLVKNLWPHKSLTATDVLEVMFPGYNIRFLFNGLKLRDNYDYYSVECTDEEYVFFRLKMPKEFEPVDEQVILNAYKK